MEKEKTNIEKINEFLEKEFNKKRPEYTYIISPKANELIEKTLKEIYPTSAQSDAHTQRKIQVSK